MGKSWERNKGQQEYLDSHLSGFLEANSNGRHEPFVAQFLEGWFDRWPQRDAIVQPRAPDEPPPTLEQVKKQANTAIEKRKKQLVNYLYWHSDPNKTAGRHAPTTKPAALESLLKPAKRTRKPQLTETYSSMYFTERIQPRLNVLMIEGKPEEETKKQLAARKLRTQNALTREMWQNETEETREAVMQQRDKGGKREALTGAEAQEGELDEEGNAEGESNGLSPRELQRNIDSLGPLLIQVSKELSRRTGWSFSILMGGLSAEGTIRSASMHHGTTLAGHTFPDSTIGFTENIMGPWGEFLWRKYSADMQNEVAEAYAKRNPGQKSKKVARTVVPQAPINAGLISFNEADENYPPVDLDPELTRTTTAPGPTSSSIPTSIPPTLPISSIEASDISYEDLFANPTGGLALDSDAYLGNADDPGVINYAALTTPHGPSNPLLRPSNASSNSSSSYQDSENQAFDYGLDWVLPPNPGDILENFMRNTSDSVAPRLLPEPAHLTSPPPQRNIDVGPISGADGECDTRADDRRSSGVDGTCGTGADDGKRSEAGSGGDGTEGADDGSPDSAGRGGAVQEDASRGDTGGDERGAVEGDSIGCTGASHANANGFDAGQDGACHTDGGRVGVDSAGRADAEEGDGDAADREDPGRVDGNDTGRVDADRDDASHADGDDTGHMAPKVPTAAVAQSKKATKKKTTIPKARPKPRPVGTSKRAPLQPILLQSVQEPQAESNTRVRPSRSLKRVERPDEAWERENERKKKARLEKKGR